MLLFITSLSFTSSANPPVDNKIKTTGTLAVSAVTNSLDGTYAPDHVVAIWIEDNSGKFVKTLLVNAQTRRGYLSNWLSATSSANSVDAITGATLNDHGTLTCSWNGTDASGAQVSDGIYKVCLELTEDHTAGNFATFTFTKGTAVDTQTPANKSGFSSVSLKWTPQ
jgi:hypothetical protein